MISLEENACAAPSRQLSPSLPVPFPTAPW
jgi:hypothetical protein